MRSSVTVTLGQTGLTSSSCVASKDWQQALAKPVLSCQTMSEKSSALPSGV